ncbi:hypothetical protein D3C72_1303440 [compost metagenome]
MAGRAVDHVQAFFPGLAAVLHLQSRQGFALGGKAPADLVQGGGALIRTQLAPGLIVKGVPGNGHGRVHVLRRCARDNAGYAAVGRVDGGDDGVAVLAQAPVGAQPEGLVA